MERVMGKSSWVLRMGCLRAFAYDLAWCVCVASVVVAGGKADANWGVSFVFVCVAGDHRTRQQQTYDLDGCRSPGRRITFGVRGHQPDADKQLQPHIPKHFVDLAWVGSKWEANNNRRKKTAMRRCACSQSLVSAPLTAPLPSSLNPGRFVGGF
jgi:hypothetical protein